MYLKEAMDNYKYNYPFHMPGHKRNYSFFNKPIEEYDITEFYPFDNLQKPEHTIKNSLERIGRIFKAHKSFISVNGSSLGLIASIMYSCSKGDKILVDRNCHKSVFNGVYLSKAIPAFIYPKFNEYNFPYTYVLSHIEENVIKHKPKALIITSPTYEGYVMSIQDISIICNKYNVILIVDEAHGSHFPFSEEFPKSSISYGDFVINSLHKTMAGLNQTSLIHTSSKIDGNRFQSIINMLQTTSPSYIFLYSIDKLMEDLENKYINFDTFIKELKNFRYNLKKLKNIKLIENDDISRIVLYSKYINGKDLDLYFRENGFQCEASSYNSITFIATVFDDINIFSIFQKSIIDLDNSLNSQNEIDTYELFEFLRLETAEPFDILNTTSKLIYYKNSLGKINLNNIVPYPPGVPLITSGEIINEAAIELLSRLIKENYTILGLNEHKKIEIKD